MKMFESIAVLIIFFILLVFGFIFYSKVVKHRALVDLEEKKQLESIEIAQRVSFLPELICTSGEEIENYGCIDWLKLKKAVEIMRANKEHYHDILGYTKITVKKIYPPGEELLLYNNTFGENKMVSIIPSLLYDATSEGSCSGVGRGSCSFGILIVEVYS